MPWRTLLAPAGSPRVGSEALAALTRLSQWCAIALIVGLLGASWSANMLAGGSRTVFPHLFYVPIICAANRGGRWAAAATSLAAGILAGPLLPLDVDAGTAQDPAAWALRLVMFIGIGQVTSALMHWSFPAIGEELRLAKVPAAIRLGLVRDEFALDYQPIVRLEDGAVVGAEALVRWTHPRLGVLPPTAFIPDAERSGAIVELGRWVHRAAIGELAGWHASTDIAWLYVSINVSAGQLTAPGFAADLHESVRAAGVRPSAVVVEVTESDVIADIEAAAGVLAEVRAAGVRVAIDDFGTGHSSLAYLEQLPVDVLKVDRSFVANLGHGSANVAAGIIGLAAGLELDVIAEGIEEPRQAEVLQNLTCAYGQGFLYSEPVAPQVFIAHARRHGPDRVPGPGHVRPPA